MSKCDFCNQEKSDTKVDADGKTMCKDCFMDCDDFTVSLNNIESGNLLDNLTIGPKIT